MRLHFRAVIKKKVFLKNSHFWKSGKIEHFPKVIFIWNFRYFPKFSRFSKIWVFQKKNVKILKIDFLHDKKIFFPQFFLWFLIYISTDARNHLEHPGSELHTRISRNAKKSLFFPLIDTYPTFELPTWWILCVTADETVQYEVECYFYHIVTQ